MMLRTSMRGRNALLDPQNKLKGFEAASGRWTKNMTSSG